MRAERLAKDHFFACMRGMSSSSAADGASGSDMWRRGAPTPNTVSLDALLPGLSGAGGPAECAAAWAAGCSSARELPLPAPLPYDLKETTHLHPLLNSLFRAATPLQLRLWWERVAADDVPHAEAKPDFLVTRDRDAQPSLLGAVAIVEVKLPGAIQKAVSQACAYMRRRIFKLVSESDERGEDLSSIFTWGVATDGEEVVLLRMRSGAPLAPATFEHCTPCPVDSSPPLMLLNWAWRERPQPPLGPSEPPPSPGFVALAHLLSTSCSEARAWEAALSGMNVLLLEVAGKPCGGGGGEEHRQLHLELPQRLGSGGSCDVYSVAPGSGIAELDGAVLKFPRAATAHTIKALQQERTALGRLHKAGMEGLVPVCVAHGARAHSQWGTAWPLLLMRPQGTPVVQWLAGQLAAAGGGGGGAAADAGGNSPRQRFATHVALRVALALRAAHALRIIHCDVRPSNIVVAGGEAVLVDWGLALGQGENAAGRGVEEFCDAEIFSCKVYAARPAQDALALLLTWLALACDRAGGAPWLAREEAAAEKLDRGEWLEARKAAGGAVQRVVDAIARLAAAAQPADPMDVAIAALEGP